MQTKLRRSSAYFPFRHILFELQTTEIFSRTNFRAPSIQTVSPPFDYQLNTNISILHRFWKVQILRGLNWRQKVSDCNLMSSAKSLRHSGSQGRSPPRQPSKRRQSSSSQTFSTKKLAWLSFQPQRQWQQRLRQCSMRPRATSLLRQCPCREQVRVEEA